MRKNASTISRFYKSNEVAQGLDHPSEIEISYQIQVETKL